MRAFENAVELGYRYVETDVHTTSDGVLVAFHDDYLDRVTDRQGKICDLAWSEVGSARVAARDPPAGGHPRRLARRPGQHRPQARRVGRPPGRGAERCQAYDRVCVAAFSDRRLARFRAARPTVGSAPRWGPAASPGCAPGATASPPGGSRPRAPRSRQDAGAGW